MSFHFSVPVTASYAMVSASLRAAVLTNPTTYTVVPSGLTATASPSSMLAPGPESSTRHATAPVAAS